jgi:hypothetical protein
MTIDSDLKSDTKKQLTSSRKPLKFVELLEALSILKSSVVNLKGLMIRNSKIRSTQ